MRPYESEDPLIAELSRFIWTYAEHDPECPAFTMDGPAVMDPANCSCGLTLRHDEIVAKIAELITRAGGAQ